MFLLTTSFQIHQFACCLLSVLLSSAKQFSLYPIACGHNELVMLTSLQGIQMGQMGQRQCSISVFFKLVHFGPIGRPHIVQKGHNLRPQKLMMAICFIKNRPPFNLDFV